MWFNVDKTLFMNAQQDVLLVASYLPPMGSSAYAGTTAKPIHILSDELEVRARGRHVLLLGDLNARVGTLVDTAPYNLLTGLEHLMLPSLGPTHEASVITTRNNADKGVNPFGRELVSMCITHDMVIANGRTVGDAAGSCTLFSDNGEGSSNVDLAIVSSLLYPSLTLLDILPKWECSDHLPVKLGWLTNNSIPTTRAPGDHNSSKRRGLKFAEEKTDKFHAEIGNVRVNSDLTNCISSLSTGQCGVDEALHTLGKIIKNYMKRAFGISNNKTGPTGASWWNSDCENAKLKFREAHRKDTEGIQIAGALRLSAETSFF